MAPGRNVYSSELEKAASVTVLCVCERFDFVTDCGP